MKKNSLIAGVALFVIITAGCGAKALEPFHDAPTTHTRDSSPAQVVEMPDGFSNVATKCVGSDRLFVAFKADANRAAIAVAVNSASCAK